MAGPLFFAASLSNAFCKYLIVPNISIRRIIGAKKILMNLQFLERIPCNGKAEITFILLPDIIPLIAYYDLLFYFCYITVIFFNL